MTRIREWLLETSKFASVVVTYWIVSLIPVKFNFPAGKLVEMGLEAILASTIAYIVWGFVVGRPTIELLWRVADTREPEGGRPTLAPLQVVNVEIRISGESWTSKAIRSYTKARQGELEIDFRPPGAHLVVLQSAGRNSPIRLNATQTGIVLNNFRANSGPAGIAEIQFIRDGTFTIPNPIDISVTQRWSPALRRLCPKLLRVHPGVEGFILRGS
ncbi:hypothetical protein MFTT_06500 [Mycolicibacterium fortuitum subsp. fortuitum]|nr:hypothetical protein MFTT_06500 [Mycolicibacterium fortuitum subsp. fortuitum]CRL54793.1 hypothetical protein CPGR_02090 [Mycolicibacterium fortuitum subsp. fortuitum DSM 46621 = ATCC 6841 = JCM 6387]CRL79620.1 hypothetical protein CPGR_02815 [Mycolicibacter nonchromogenicus]